MSVTLIEQVDVGAGGVASITFSSIPDTFTDLKILWVHRNTGAETQTRIEFNGSSTNFTERMLYGLGNAAFTYASGPNFPTWSNTTATTANTFSSTEIYIPNYASSNIKPFSAESVVESNSTSTGIYLLIHSMLWSDTSPISSITLKPAANNFAEFSTASLFGITAS